MVVVTLVAMVLVSVIAVVIVLYGGGKIKNDDPTSKSSSTSETTKVPVKQEIKKANGKVTETATQPKVKTSYGSSSSVAPGDFEKFRKMDNNKCVKTGGQSLPAKPGPEMDKKTGLWNASAFAGGKYSPPPPSHGCKYVKDPSAHKAGSGWCNRKEHSEPLTQKASRLGLRIGRMSVFDGPNGQCVHCGVNMGGNAVALSTKYMPSAANFANTPACGKCVCFKLVGLPPEKMVPPPKGIGKLSPEMQKGFDSGLLGKVFKSQVIDRCAECEDDHVDVFVGTPGNREGAFAEAAKKAGVDLYGLGVGVVEWGFVDCNKPCSSIM